MVYQELDDGWIMATIPELPGAVTQARSMPEARDMIKEAAALLIESYRENARKDALGSAIWETMTVELPATA